MAPPESRPTPYLLVDRDRLATNIGELARFAAARGLALRPHAKTHKCAEIARLQVEAGAVGLTVATVGEAERFASAGLTDLFVAYPLWVDAAKGARLRALGARATVTVGVDSVEGARALAGHCPGQRVLVEVDSGMHRTGVGPAEAGAVAVAADRAGLRVDGVFTFPGHSYAPGASTPVALQESEALAAAAADVRRQGIDVRVVSGGSTPSMSAAHADVLTEARPGVYVFGDAQQWELGTTSPDRLALTCVATVVSHAGGRVVLDSGSKVLGADRQQWASGFGRLLDHPGARVVALSEHHAVVEWVGHGALPPLGTRLRVVPNHVCTAVNLAEDLVCTDGSPWPVFARAANT